MHLTASLASLRWDAGTRFTPCISQFVGWPVHEVNSEDRPRRRPNDATSLAIRECVGIGVKCNHKIGNIMWCALAVAHAVLSSESAFEAGLRRQRRIESKDEPPRNLFSSRDAHRHGHKHFASLSLLSLLRSLSLTLSLSSARSLSLLSLSLSLALSRSRSLARVLSLALSLTH